MSRLQGVKAISLFGFSSLNIGIIKKSTFYSEQKSLTTKVQKFLAFSCLVMLLFSSCDEQKVKVASWTEFEPVYMSVEEFKNAVVTESPRDLVDPGKIYLYQDYLFVNEVNEGIHIIENSDPANPVNVGFINIPANKDIAIQNGLLYADSQSDLLVFDINSIQNPELLHREVDVFKFISTKNQGFPYQQIDPSKGIVVDWKEVKVEEVCESNMQCGPQGIWGWRNGGIVTSEDGGAVGSPETNGGNNVTGVGGSMARFTIAGNYLYAVDDMNLLSFDISNAEPVNTKTEEIGWRIETIFPYQDYLFIGSQSAMYIYDISTPQSPVEASRYNHFTACDPIVVQNDIAYVTLRSDRVQCPRSVNRLEVIDVEDPKNPREMKVYEMKNPHGLGIDGNYLFVSEGDNGIKIMDASDPENIEVLRFVENIKSFDVIPFNNVLMVTGKDGIVQYDYSNIEDIKRLSTIPVVEETGS
jgi:hypothetical protein